MEHSVLSDQDKFIEQYHWKMTLFLFPGLWNISLTTRLSFFYGNKKWARVRSFSSLTSQSILHKWLLNILVVLCAGFWMEVSLCNLLISRGPFNGEQRCPFNQGKDTSVVLVHDWISQIRKLRSCFKSTLSSRVWGLCLTLAYSSYREAKPSCKLNFFRFQSINTQPLCQAKRTTNTDIVGWESTEILNELVFGRPLLEEEAQTGHKRKDVVQGLDPCTNFRLNLTIAWIGGTQAWIVPKTMEDTPGTVGVCVVPHMVDRVNRILATARHRTSNIFMACSKVYEGKYCRCRHRIVSLWFKLRGRWQKFHTLVLAPHQIDWATNNFKTMHTVFDWWWWDVSTSSQKAWEMRHTSLAFM